MNKWYKVALFNLIILALLGLILRYKINFPLEFIEQKKILHAHSHFAFNGWISFLLQLLILDHFTTQYQQCKKFWNRFFIASTIINYAMIFSFSIQGYSALSIIFSNAALFLSYIFCYKIYTGLKLSGNQLISRKFILAALFFLVLSSLGPFALAYIIATKNVHQYWYHNALYFFLHFQYNGWFTFGILGLLFQKLEASATYNRKLAIKVFTLLTISCIPSYLLTVLWYHPSYLITVTNVITVCVQTLGLFFLIIILYKNVKQTYAGLPAICKWLYTVSIAAFFLKGLLQFFSAYPDLGKLAFSFRPIIIGYLHLIFLVFVSIYLISLLAEKAIIPLAKNISRIALILFSSAVIINEALLGIQGLSSIYYYYMPWVNMLLFINTIFILLGAVLLFIAAYKNVSPQLNYKNIKQ